MKIRNNKGVYSLLTLFISSVLIVGFYLSSPLVQATERSFDRESFMMQGSTEGTGVHFEITDSDYLDVTLDSTDEITVRIRSVPEIITISFSPDLTTFVTEVTLSGLTPLTIYYKFEDNYHNLTPFTTDAIGRYIYTQDISQTHFVFIQPRKSTKFINDNATGGDCTLIGNWNVSTKTCTLTTDVSETIQIDSNNITLDGGSHTLSGTATGFGVLLDTKSNVTIRNLTIEDFFAGIFLNFSEQNTLINNAISNTREAILFDNSHDNVVESHTFLNTRTDIVFFDSNNNSIHNNNNNVNTVTILRHDAILFIESHNNTIDSNSMVMNADALGVPRFFSREGILFFDSNSNTITENIFFNTHDGILVFDSNDNIIKNNTFENNQLDGLILFTGNNHQISNNIFKDNQENGFLFFESHNNQISDNIFINNQEDGILFFDSNNNQIHDNTFENNQLEGLLFFDSENNQIFNNNFINNVTQAQGFGGVNSFNLASPVGGNFWNNFDTPAEGCDDTNSDNFCDAPFVFTGGQDNLPWTIRDGWIGAPPVSQTMKNPTIGGAILKIFKPKIDPGHLGIDIDRNIASTTVRATAAGTVFRVDKIDDDFFGKWVWIFHGDVTDINGTASTSISTLYLHLEEINPLLSEGQPIAQNTPLGVVDSSGAVTGPHLHFSIRQGVFPLGATSTANTTTTPLDPREFVNYEIREDALSVDVTSPVDIVLTDPDGLLISKQVSEIANAEYFEIKHLSNDLIILEEIGKPNYDTIKIDKRKEGDYSITIVPEPNALPTDTFSLSITSAGTTAVLAENVLISDIPEQSYILRSTETDIEKIIPAKVNIVPKTLNLNKKGVFTALIEFEKGFGVSVKDVNRSTLVIGNTSAFRTFIADNRLLVVQFRTQDLTDVESGKEVELMVSGTLQDGTVFESVDIIRVINKNPLGIRGVQLSSLLANLHEALTQLLTLLKSR